MYFLLLSVVATSTGVDATAEFVTLAAGVATVFSAWVHWQRYKLHLRQVEIEIRGKEDTPQPGKD